MKESQLNTNVWLLCMVQSMAKEKTSENCVIQLDNHSMVNCTGKSSLFMSSLAESAPGTYVCKACNVPFAK